MAEDEVEQEEKEPEHPVSFLWVLLLPLLGAGAWGVWVILSPNQEDAPPGAFSAFNLPEAPKPENRFLPGQQSAAPAAPQAGAGAAKPRLGPGLGGFVQEASTLFVKPKAGQGPGSSKAEQDFVKKYGPAVRKYQEGYLYPLAQKYYKQYPIVREVDAAFAKLDRYMAASRQYAQDRDMYKWARSVIALPDVRKTAMKYALRPETWKVAIQMSLEALKNPPPKPVYAEMQRFITADKDMADFIGQFAMELIPHMSRMLAQAMIPAGTDLRPLQNLVSSVAPPDIQNMASKQLPPAKTQAQSRGH
ncbi:MAG: hypothetical protein HY922_10925 [Elusimicrobia bacterium]|nr:hypothetical protein [Elusimicrobiota bacterium]